MTDICWISEQTPGGSLQAWEAFSCLWAPDPSCYHPQEGAWLLVRIVTQVALGGRGEWGRPACWGPESMPGMRLRPPSSDLAGGYCRAEWPGLGWGPSPSPGPASPTHSAAGHTGRLLRALLGLSLLFLVAHLALQICLHTVPHLDQLLGPSCSRWETLSRHIGVTRLDLKDIPNAIRLVAPDLGILVVSSVCLGLCGRLARNTQQSPHTQELVRAAASPMCQGGHLRAVVSAILRVNLLKTNVDFLVVSWC